MYPFWVICVCTVSLHILIPIVWSSLLGEYWETLSTEQIQREKVGGGFYYSTQRQIGDQIITTTSFVNPFTYTEVTTERAEAKSNFASKCLFVEIPYFGIFIISLIGCLI